MKFYQVRVDLCRLRCCSSVANGVEFAEYDELENQVGPDCGFDKCIKLKKV